jgi:hypothetical protein
VSEDALPADQLVAVYRKIRDAIDAKETAHKAEIEGLKEKLDTVGARLLDICNTQGVDSLRTNAGTATRTTRTRYWTSDWEHMYSFIKEHDAPHLLEQRIHTGNMKTFLDTNPDDMPIGLNADTKYVITVRKPTNR